jgi:hypothetical protein
MITRHQPWNDTDDCSERIQSLSAHFHIFSSWTETVVLDGFIHVHASSVTSLTECTSGTSMQATNDCKHDEQALDMLSLQCLKTNIKQHCRHGSMNDHSEPFVEHFHFKTCSKAQSHPRIMAGRRGDVAPIDAAHVSSKTPPGWDPGDNKNYPYRVWLQDVKLWWKRNLSYLGMMSASYPSPIKIPYKDFRRSFLLIRWMFRRTSLSP